MKINDLVFGELFKRGFELEGSTRVWSVEDSKLWYLTSRQAKGFLNASMQGKYKKSVFDKEVKLIKKHLREISSFIPENSCNIVDLGCGDGKKAALFIKEMSKNKKLRYCPIDISSYMVSKAAGTINEMNCAELLEFKWNISDFENLENITPLFREKGFEKHLMVLTGNTMGNFDCEDILSWVKNSMKKGDVLVIGNGLVGENKNKNAFDYKNRGLNEFLSETIRQIGLKKDDVEFNTRFNKKRVELFYTLKKDKTIRHAGKKVEFRKGDLIITGISYKYSKKELRKILLGFFSFVKIYSDEKNSYALAVCKK